MPRFEPDHQDNYAYLSDLCRRAASATNDELVKGIRSECHPDLIREAKIDNGGNQVAMLGVIIQEAGRRRLEKAAPLIAEFCTWPWGDDFWVHLVPKALRALKMIGDLSVVPRLEEIVNLNPETYRIIVATVLTMTGVLPKRKESDWKPASSSLTSRASIVVLAAQEEIISLEEVIRWADGEIEKVSDVPPDWLCDLAIASTTADGIDRFPVISSTWLASPVLAFGWRAGRISMPDALTRIWYLSIPEDATRSSRNELDEVLHGAIEEWVFQENSPIRDQIIRMSHGASDEGTTDELEDPWINPEKLDKAGEALYRRIVGIFDALIEERSEVRATLDPILFE